MAIKVKLRQKAISGNRQSLYLDFYPPIPHPETGTPTRREFLQMYIAAQPKTPADKAHNKETQQLAEQIRQKKEIELNKPEIYTGFEQEKLKVKELGERNFVAYFRQIADRRKGSNYDNWVSALNYLNDFTGGTLKFADLNESFCNDFKHYLSTAKSKRSTQATLSPNSIASYYNKLRATLKQAYKDGLLQTDLNAKIESAKPAETKRNFLTIDELNALAKADCPNPMLKKAALFSALTGLRFSDVVAITWGQLEYATGQGYYLHFTQQKTQGIEVLPISEQAYQLLGTKGAKDQKIFEELHYSAYLNRHLIKWAQVAAITKHVTFHCFRHTFATLQLSEGTDIYTVSKMLGHKDLKTTQIYAKVVDESKRAAANRIKLDM